MGEDESGAPELRDHTRTKSIRRHIIQRTRIEWVKNPDGTQGMSWNPIKGLCPVNCWYCYAKPLYARFEWMQEGMGDIGYLAEWELEQPIKRKKPAGIFVCSTYELFHTPDKFARDEVFKIIEKCPQHRFYILTKFPENIDRQIPDNVWLGVTVEDSLMHHERVHDLVDTKRSKATIKFVSFEPLLGSYFHTVIPIKELDWVIVGRLTGHGNKYDPDRASIERIAEDCRLEFHTPLFLKNNLKRIWGGPLIQEFPCVE